jgi:hypothetical protein
MKTFASLLVAAALLAPAVSFAGAPAQPAAAAPHDHPIKGKGVSTKDVKQ